MKFEFMCLYDEDLDFFISLMNFDKLFFYEYFDFDLIKKDNNVDIL